MNYYLRVSGGVGGGGWGAKIEVVLGGRAYLSGGEDDKKRSDAEVRTLRFIRFV